MSQPSKQLPSRRSLLLRSVARPALVGVVAGAVAFVVVPSTSTNAG